VAILKMTLAGRRQEKPAGLNRRRPLEYRDTARKPTVMLFFGLGLVASSGIASLGFD
jgi:hypothetical protein